MAARGGATIDVLLSRLAKKIAETAPEGWLRVEQVLSLCQRRVRSRGARLLLPDGTVKSGDAVLTDELSDIYRCDGLGADELTLAIEVDADGGFRAYTSRILMEDMNPHGNGLLYVLMPDVLPPDPGDDEEGPTNPIQAGDPHEAVQLLWQYLRKRMEIFGRPKEEIERVGSIADVLPEPLDNDETEELLGSVDFVLPDDLLALYRVADGDGGSFGHRLINGYVWFELEQLIYMRDCDDWWGHSVSWRYHSLDKARHGDSGNAVRRSAYRRGWIPFATDESGNFLAVDMDPAVGGRPGQVIRVMFDPDDGGVYVAESVTALLRSQFDALERGDFECDVDQEFILFSGAPRQKVVRCYSIGEAVTAHAEVQEIFVRDTSDTDLRPLRGARRLRLVRLHQSTVVDLAPLADVPVESLDLDLEAADLAPLAGHPTLRTLKVRAGQPVSLAPIRGCRRLYGLDLSGASVRDIDMVAELEGLRYLSMRHDQWADLWQRVDAVPLLAAASLAGPRTIEQEVEWAGRFMVDDRADDLRYYTGRWDPR